MFSNFLSLLVRWQGVILIKVVLPHGILDALRIIGIVASVNVRERIDERIGIVRKGHRLGVTVVGG